MTVGYEETLLSIGQFAGSASCVSSIRRGTFDRRLLVALKRADEHQHYNQREQYTEQCVRFAPAKMGQEACVSFAALRIYLRVLTSHNAGIASTEAFVLYVIMV